MFDVLNGEQVNLRVEESVKGKESVRGKEVKDGVSVRVLVEVKGDILCEAEQIHKV